MSDDPILVSAMRRMLERGRGEDHVRTWSPTTGKMGSGTTVRGFLQEYDEALLKAHDEGYAQALAEHAYDV